MKLSVLKNAVEGTTTYYVGDDIEHIKHLSNCTLITKKKFDGLDNVEQIITENPQLYFYKLSHEVPNEYTFDGNYTIGNNCNIHTSVVIGDNVVIGDGVTIGPNTVVYSKTSISDNTSIGANVTIGASGMMWVWDRNTRVFLKQLGGVYIGENSIIGSNSVIVRGSANEVTTINQNVNMAPGCCIGHGTYVEENVHFANNITIGGSVYISSNNFLSGGCIINPGVQIKSQNVVIGAGCVVNNDINTTGVYVGVPAKKIKDVEDNMKGIPKWGNI